MDAGFEGLDPQWLSHVDEMCGLLLASIPRSDQRRWGELYVRGLLLAEGRKTMQAIADVAGTTAMQSLQQFISSSPWDWRPVRQSLARHMDREIQPRAWIVEPLVVPKAGKHSVGVERQFAIGLGKVANCQQSSTVWLASEVSSCPVDWQLALPTSWVAVPEQRKRAAIPDRIGATTPLECAIDSVVDMAQEWRLTPRPVVMSVPNADLPRAVRTFTGRRVPFVLRIEGSLPVVASDPARAVSERRTLPAHQLTEALKDQAAAVEWRDFGRSRHRVSKVVGTRVGLPTPVGHMTRAMGTPPLLLVGAWTDPASTRPTEFWLSNVSHLSSSALFRIARLTRRVSQDLHEISDRVGVRDFAGRTFRGWHHHATLVSLAHAISVLSRAAGRSGAPYAPALPLRRLIGSR
ncbi:transposase [Streptomyces noursei]|uniref:IS701 family transposase n=1 Tax=Streptomyces noursei TaxID=1971 RepID=UPI001965A91C|nr:transposase [Streptomyces noursei]QRX95823.1 transposase [Streptomyces noursei]